MCRYLPSPAAWRSLPALCSWWNVGRNDFRADGPEQSFRRKEYPECRYSSSFGSWLWVSVGRTTAIAAGVRGPAQASGWAPSYLSFSSLTCSAFSAELLHKRPSMRQPAEEASTVQAQAAEHVQDYQDNQDHADNPDASTRTPSPISVIASAAAEQEQQNDNEQNQSHRNLLSVSNMLRQEFPL